jgi:hypothetical protein
MSRAPDFSPRQPAQDYATEQANAVNPPKVECSSCTEEMWGGYGIDGQWFCRDCVPRDSFFALARECSASIHAREASHAR